MDLEVSRLRKIKLLALDVDGVLTDCRVFLDSSGEWRRLFSIRDGYGLKRLIEAGYKTAIITGTRAQDIRERAKALGIHYFYEGHLNKGPVLDELAKEASLNLSEIAYMGDDIFDVPVLQKVGFAASVPDAMDEALKVSHYITRRPAGNGAVREICDFIVQYGAFAEKGKL
ncbi:MAG: 3-deoxy-D-manno-octulosonate 8-phosphate phosphatase [Oligoflexia bacterium]|nr:MAG: 3-deoxy-D-manno-octulosonate 8-phosphate phosphatase [Oligoflexia bacterium]